jgi:hypothetical protein
LDLGKGSLAAQAGLQGISAVAGGAAKALLGYSAAIQNGERVNSATVVECTDDQVKKLTVARAGIGSNCGYFNGWMKRGGQDVQYRAISCQLPDGSWEVLDTYGQ